MFKVALLLVKLKMFRACKAYVYILLLSHQSALPYRPKVYNHQFAKQCI
jgi:hypothetical protein